MGIHLLYVGSLVSVCLCPFHDHSVLPFQDSPVVTLVPYHVFTHPILFDVTSSLHLAVESLLC